jgi:nitroreductase
METMEAISRRRSIRRFTDAPVPRALIERVLDAAVLAPSAKNAQTWRFVVLAPEIQSIGAMIQNMLLADEVLGLGTPWICDVLFAYPLIRDWLGRRNELVAAVSIGYAAEAPAARPRTPWAGLTEWREAEGPDAGPPRRALSPRAPPRPGGRRSSGGATGR